MLIILFIKNILENNLEEEEEQWHTTAVTVSDTLAKFAGKSHDIRNFLNAVEHLFKFLVVLPAFSATAEWSFSTLHRLKNYLRLTRPMTQERLNHVAVHHVHKTRVDALDINKIKHLFIHANEYRRSVVYIWTVWHLT